MIGKKGGVLSPSAPEVVRKPPGRERWKRSPTSKETQPPKHQRHYVVSCPSCWLLTYHKS